MTPRLQRWLAIADVVLRLGIGNVLWVAAYRFGLKTGFYRWRSPLAAPLDGPFLVESAQRAGGTAFIRYFSFHEQLVDSPPDWFRNPFTDSTIAPARQHWSQIPDFMPDAGDIKVYWELSRFDWLARDAWRYRGGDTNSGARLELWLRDWAQRNPPNAGANWKCGQETSLRSLNLLIAALCMGDAFNNPRPQLLSLLFAHLHRVSVSLRYAMAQDNNHGTSEACALFAVGHYLAQHSTGAQSRQSARWAAVGRRWLENRVSRLIMADGTFSQYSVTYHRLMLDTLSLAELMRVQLVLPPFSDLFYERAQLAVHWLFRLVRPDNGDAPNLGANDGACLFNLTDAPYRDFRPSVILASAVFLKRRAYPANPPHPLMTLLPTAHQALPEMPAAESALCAQGGLAVLHHGSQMAVLRLPVFRFRPSQADALHLDLWVGGENLIRDAGTFSYNGQLAGRDSQQLLASTQSHSTAQFDQRDQMPRLGRFLYGKWLGTKQLAYDPRGLVAEAGYVDYRGAGHTRRVQAIDAGWQVTDTISRFDKEATIRWRLPPAEWHLDGQSLRGCGSVITIRTDGEIALSLKMLEESLHYMQCDLIPVLEIRCLRPGIVQTNIEMA